MLREKGTEMARLHYSNVLDTFINFLEQNKQAFFEKEGDDLKKELIEFIEILNELKNFLESTNIGFANYDKLSPLSSLIDDLEKDSSKKLRENDLSKAKELYLFNQNENNSSFEDVGTINSRDNKDNLYKVLNFFNKSIEKKYKKLITQLGRNVFKVIDNKQTNKQVFLSYAHDDYFYTLALVVFFYDKENIMLFVDWMKNPAHANGIVIKKFLSKELSNSDDFLFLRSLHSELRIRGNQNVRQWCAWEVGYFYQNISSNKTKTMFFTNYLLSADKTNKFLDDFTFCQSLNQF